MSKTTVLEKYAKQIGAKVLKTDEKTYAKTRKAEQQAYKELKKNTITWDELVEITPEKIKAALKELKKTHNNPGTYVKIPVNIKKTKKTELEKHIEEIGYMGRSTRARLKRKIAFLEAFLIYTSDIPGKHKKLIEQEIRKKKKTLKELEDER